jgi:polysaccharide export outer membrane protein
VASTDRTAQTRLRAIENPSGPFRVALVAPLAVWVSFMINPVQASCESDEYVLGVEDVLQVSVWQQPDLTMSVIIRPDGKISFPLLGDVQAAGRTAEQLAGVIRKGLTEYVRDPIVTILVQEIKSFGKVASQGVLELKTCTQVVQALAQSGGFTSFADKTKILLIRRKGEREIRRLIDYKKILSGDNPELNILLEPGDTIIVD